MSSTIGRRFQVEYGEGDNLVTIGTGTTRIDAERGKLTINQSVENFSIEFSFVLIATTSALLESETESLQEKLKLIRQPVKITINGEVAWNFKHEDNTGFNSRVTLRKVGGPKDGGLARTFHCKIDLGLPFNDLGPDNDLKGRRSSQVSISYSPQRRVSLNISGEYACDTNGPHNAIQNYYRAIEAYVTTVKASMLGSLESHDGAVSGLSVVLERVSEDYSYDDQEMILNFSISEQEILYPQNRRDEAPGIFDDPDIFNQSLSITQSRSWPGDSPRIKVQKGGGTASGGGDGDGRYRITKRNASYTCLVKKSASDVPDWKDSDVTDILESKYLSVIRPFLIHELNNLEEFQGAEGGHTCTIVEESVSYGKTEMSVSASMTVDIIRNSASTEGTVLQKSLTMTDDESMGKYFVPVWATSNKGGRLSKYLFNGPGSHVRRVTAVYRVMNTGNQSAIMGLQNRDGIKFLGDDRGDMEEITPLGNGWVLLDKHAEATVIEVGTPKGGVDETKMYTITDYTLSTVSERFEEVGGSEDTGDDDTPNGRRSVAGSPDDPNQPDWNVRRDGPYTGPFSAGVLDKRGMGNRNWLK